MDFIARRVSKMSFVATENLSSGFPTRSETNRTVQQQKMARDLKIKKVEELYYLYSENKGHGADQLRLYFRICIRQVFL